MWILESKTMKAAGEFVAKVGIPGALALGMLYLFGLRNDSRMDAVTASSAAMVQLLHSHVEATSPMVTMQQQILNVNLAQCVNSARAERQPVDTCFSALYQQPVRPQTPAGGQR